MHKKIIFIIAIFTLLFATSIATAKPETIQRLETVEVTGSRIAEDTAEISAQTYILTREDIERSGALTVSEALKYIPGLMASINDASMAQKKGVTMRGLTSEMLYLIDGVPISDPNHGTGSELGNPVDLRSIDMDIVERIEVLKGSASAIYGSDAAGGVVNIITKKPFAKPQASTSLSAGSNEYFSTSTRAGVAEGDFRATIGYRYTREGEARIRKRLDGNYDTTDHYSANDYNFSLGYKNWSFTGFAGQNKSRWHTSEFGDEDYTQKNTYGRYSLQYDDGKFLGRIYLHKMESLNYNDSQSENTDVSSETFGVTATRRTMLGVLPFAYGLDYKRDSSSYLDRITPTSSFERKRFEVAPYLETSIPFGLCSLDIGLRYEYWNMEGGANHKELMPRFSFNFANENGTIYYVTVARHFSMPTLYQMFTESAWVISNPDLKPESGWDYEIGVKNNEAKNPWSVNFFYINLDDKINYETIDPATWRGQYRNVDKYRAYGVEGNYKWNFHENWSLAPAISYTYAEEQSGNSAWDRSKEPRWKGSATLAYQKNGWQAALTGLFYIDRAFGGNDTSYNCDNIFTLDATISKKIKNATFQLAVTNLFNKEYFVNRSGYLNRERRLIFKLTYDL